MWFLPQLNIITYGKQLAQNLAHHKLKKKTYASIMITKLHNKEFTAHTNRPFSFLAMITLKAKSMQNSESKQFITGNSQNRKTLHSSNNEFGFDFTLLKPWGLDVGNFAISKGQTQTLYWGPPQWAKQPVKDLTFFHQDDVRGFFLFFFFWCLGWVCLEFDHSSLNFLAKWWKKK